MNNYFIILGAGKGQRFGGNKPKQYIKYNGKLLIEHSIDKALKSKLFKKIIVVIPKKNKKIMSKYKKNHIMFVIGGKERKDSSLNALKKIKKYRPNNVLIHDAARPDFSITLLKYLIKNLKNNNAVIPIIKPADSIKYKVKKKLINLNRNNIFLTQTPQAFKFNKLFYLSTKQKSKITDEASLFLDNNLNIKLIKGENKNRKITYWEDTKKPETYLKFIKNKCNFKKSHKLIMKLCFNS